MARTVKMQAEHGAAYGEAAPQLVDKAGWTFSVPGPRGKSSSRKSAVMSQEEYMEQYHNAEMSRLSQLFGLQSPMVVPLIEQLQSAVYQANYAKGFWEGPNADNTGEKIALMHSELSEALEADRKNIESDDKIPDFTGVEAELADTVIRILDFAGRKNLRLGEAIMAKLQFNLTRPYKHGKAY